MISAWFRMAAAALALAGSAGWAQASTFNVTTQGANPFIDSAGKNAWYEGVSYSLNGRSMTAAAGMFRLTGTDKNGRAQNFLAFCLEPLEYLRLPKSYSDGTALSSVAVGRLGALMSNAFGLVTDRRSAAAFQLAVWEIATETKNPVLNLLNGNFLVTQTSGKTRLMAQGWLSAINRGNWAPDPSVRILAAPGTQDLLTDLAPVPLPAAGLMMIAALGGLAGLRRQRRG